MKATKKLIGALVALIASLAISVGATFAWFTSSNSAKISQFELNVKSETGNLYIGLETGKLTQGVLNLTQTEVPADFKLSDVTLNSDKSFDKKDGNDASAGTDYIQFQLFFKSDDETQDMEIYLTTGSAVTCEANGANDIIIYDTEAQNKVNGTNYGAQITGGKLAANAQNAIRISFSKTTEVDRASDKIWDPHADDGFKTGNLAADYEDFVETGTWPETVGTPNGISEVAGNIEGLGTTQETAKLLTLDTNKEGSIYVTIWLEGTDGDCLNSIFADLIKVDLKFEGKLVAHSGGD